MAKDTQLEERFNYLAIGCTHRVYVLFTAEYIPLWTPLLRYILKLRQGTPVIYSHTLIAVQHMEDKVFQMYEMAFRDEMGVYFIEYEGAYYRDGQLSIDQLQYNGVTKTETWNAIDVSPYVMDPNLIDERFYESYTSVPLTPRTLWTHVTRAKDRLTWTCTGLVQVLLGYDKTEAFNNPLTPDQLHDRVTLTLQNY